MADSSTNTSTISSPAITKLSKDSNVNATNSVHSTSGRTVKELQFDNTAGSVPNYAKTYDESGAPTVGGDTPVDIVMVPAGMKVQVSRAVGVTHSNRVDFSCVTTPGTGGTTNPATTVLADIGSAA